MINSREKGKRYEIQIMNEWKKLGFVDCKTSRYASKAEDDRGVDLCNTGEYKVQCKNYTNFSVKKAIQTLKNNMPDGSKVLQIKITGCGECIVLEKEFFYNMITKICHEINKNVGQKT